MLKVNLSKKYSKDSIISEVFVVEAWSISFQVKVLCVCVNKYSSVTPAAKQGAAWLVKS